MSDAIGWVLVVAAVAFMVWDTSKFVECREMGGVRVNAKCIEYKEIRK